MLEALFGSRDRENVLQYIIARRKGYASEIAKFYGTKSSQIIKQLESLEIAGILVSFQIGRARVFELNPRYFAIKELEAFLVKIREAYRPELIEQLTRAKIAPRRKGKPLVMGNKNEANSEL